MAINNVVLEGRLTKDPEMRTSQNGTVCTFTMAIDRGKDKEGNDKGADFPRVTVFGKQGENCSKYLKKGSLCSIVGRIQTGQYQKDGQTFYTTDVVANHVNFLSSNNSQGTQGQQVTQSQSAPQSAPQVEASFQEWDDEDIPF